MYWESETPSTQHRRLHLLRSSKTGDNSERKAHEGERKFIFNLVIPRRYRLGTKLLIAAVKRVRQDERRE